MRVFLLFLLCFMNGIFGNAYEASHYVVVSIAPYKYFVEAIADDTVKVGLMVPAGVSFHAFEPTPKQVLQASNADIWFRIGESFETRAVSALQGHNPHLRIVDLREGVDLITVDQKGHQGCCHAGSADLHIWLSPQQVKIQAKAIAEALIATYPEHKQLYLDRLQSLLKDLDRLDQEITEMLKPLTNRTMMVSHSAYAYLARDYHLFQLPIEFEGRDPSPKQLNTILNEARKNQIKVIFIQPQYSSKGAKLIANEIGAQLVVLDPYSEDYFVTMREIARRIASQIVTTP